MAEEVASLKATIGVDLGNANRSLTTFAKNMEKAGESARKNSADIEGALAKAGERAQALPSKVAPATQSVRAMAMEADRLARSEINLAKTEGRWAQALDLSEKRLDAATYGTAQYNARLAEHIKLVNQAKAFTPSAPIAPAASGLPAASSVGGIDAALGSFIGKVGAATVAYKAFDMVLSSAQAGRQTIAMIDQQRLALGSLMGSQERGNQILKDAIAFGQKYGFTMRDSARAAGDAADIFRSTNQTTEKTLEVLGRLASRNTSESMSGAVYALRELQSGDITSIRERFNIGREAAHKMKDEIIAGGDAVVVLDRELARMGISTAVLENRMKGPNGQLVKMEMAGERTSIVLGKIANTVFDPLIDDLDLAAKGFEILTSEVGGFFAALDGTGAAALHNDILAGAVNFRDYTNQVSAANEQMPFYAQGIERLTPAQFAFAQAMLRTGATGEQVTATLNTLNPTMRALNDIYNETGVAGAAAQGAIAAMEPELLRIASASPQAASAIASWIEQVNHGVISAGELGQRLQWLSTLKKEFAAAAEIVTGALGGFIQKTAETPPILSAAAAALIEHQSALEINAMAAAQSAVQAEEVKLAQERLEAQTRLAAQALFDNGNAGMTAAMQLAASSSNVDLLTAAQYRLAWQTAIANGEMIRQINLAGQSTGVQLAGAVKEVRETSVFNPKFAEKYKKVKDLQSQLQQEAARQSGALADAEANLAKSRADNAGKIRILQAEQAKLDRTTTAGQTEYLRLQKEIEDLERSSAKQGAKAGASAAKAYAKDLKDAAREAEELERAQYALMTNEQKLAHLRDKLSASNNETERLELTKKIQDTEEAITKEREKQVQAAIDYKKALIDDSRKREKEQTRSEQARRVLENANSSEAQKREARRVLQEIPLDQADRALDIYKNAKDAGGASLALPGTPGGALPRAGMPSLPAGATTPGAAAGLSGGNTAFAPQIQVFLDGKEVSNLVTVTVTANVLGGILEGRQSALAGGIRRS